MSEAMGATCGRTHLVNERRKAFLDEQEYDCQGLYRCIREDGHRGEHYGPEVAHDGSERVWSDGDSDAT